LEEVMQNNLKLKFLLCL